MAVQNDPYAAPVTPDDQTLTLQSGDQYFYSKKTGQWYSSKDERDAADQQANASSQVAPADVGYTSQLNRGEAARQQRVANGQKAATGETAIGTDIAGSENANQAATANLVDRYSDLSYDPTLSNQSRQIQQQAADQYTQMYGKLASYDPQEEARRAAGLTMQNQLAIAKSATGGAGARQAAMTGAIQSAPAIEEQANANARQQLQTNQQQMLQAASGLGNVASGTRSADLAQQQSSVDTGLQVANGISAAVGRSLQITQSDAQFLAQAQLALQNLKLDWSKLTEQQREAAATEAMQQAGLDLQMKQFQASQSITPKDLLGAIMTVGGTAIGAGGQIAAATAKGGG